MSACLAASEHQQVDDLEFPLAAILLIINRLMLSRCVHRFQCLHQALLNEKPSD